jgi:hypothetical protein
MVGGRSYYLRNNLCFTVTNDSLIVGQLFGHLFLHQDLIIKLFLSEPNIQLEISINGR